MRMRVAALPFLFPILFFVFATACGGDGSASTSTPVTSISTPQRFDGTITAMTQGATFGSPWTVSVSGLTDAVSVQVIELEEGTPQVGSSVEIEGVLNGSIIGGATVKVLTSGTNIKVIQTENPYVFIPDTYEFELGKKYTLVFEPPGEFHTFNVDELGIEFFVNAGEEVRQEITPSTAGTFRLYCIPHESLGMVGQVTVS